MLTKTKYNESFQCLFLRIQTNEKTAKRQSKQNGTTTTPTTSKKTKHMNLVLVLLNLNVSIKKWIASKWLFCSLLKANKLAHFKEAIFLGLKSTPFQKEKKNSIKNN